jgi:hypothetical protein
MPCAKERRAIRFGDDYVSCKYDADILTPCPCSTQRLSEATWLEERETENVGSGGPPPPDLMDLTLIPLALLPGDFKPFTPKSQP